MNNHSGNISSYYRYWGKAKPKADNKETGLVPCHLLPFHSLDVAATGFHLMAPESPRNRALSNVLNIDPHQFQALFTFILAVHDLGKFSRAFQGLAEPDVSYLVKPDLRLIYGVRHDSLGMLLWKRFLCLHQDLAKTWRFSQEGSLERQTRRALEVLLGASFGHHGQPVVSGNELLENYFLEEDVQAAWEFSAATADLIRPQWPEQLMADKLWSQKLKQVSWHLAGQAVLADWLGSDQVTFPYLAEPIPLGDYWHNYALPQAERQVSGLGFNSTLKPSHFPGVEHFFGFQPTPLQQWAETAQLSEGPELFILEDVTGAGKTEAALTLAHRLLEREQVQGVYFGLPTMATSNAMYGRIADIYQRWFEAERPPNLVLAHGARQLNEDFSESVTDVIPSQPGDTNYGSDESSASAFCNRWFADSRKKALLADVGVGTVDQVLMGLLPFRHQALRLIGLANKLLIVDEIHACDDYMLTLLTAVLEAHAKQGGCAVLLTATLPLKMRRKLVDAWQRGLGTQAEVTENADSQAFPLATQVSSEGLQEQALETRKSVERSVSVQRVGSEESVIESLVEAARQGQCACWIRNTVDDAIRAYELLAAQVPEPEKLLLFHSRFIMADRQSIEQAALTYFGKSSHSDDRTGRILIGTQVIEQSLDLDFDVMVSDLAPIDLLIQRAGRLHRHRRSSTGDLLVEAGSRDQRKAPVLNVLAPPLISDVGNDWVRRFLPGTAAVYQNHAHLWLTLDILLNQTAISMPGEARLLIESVYGDEAEEKIPEGLKDSYFADEGERQSQVAMGRFNQLTLEKGYVQSSAANGWQDEVDIGTRLSDEPSVTVTLVVLDESGTALRPFADIGRHAWEMSQIKVRQSLAKKLPEWPGDLEPLRERLLETKPGLRFSQLWLYEKDIGNLRYDNSLGLHKAQAAEIPRFTEESANK